MAREDPKAMMQIPKVLGFGNLQPVVRRKRIVRCTTPAPHPSLLIMQRHVFHMPSRCRKDLVVPPAAI